MSQNKLEAVSTNGAVDDLRTSIDTFVNIIKEGINREVVGDRQAAALLRIGVEIQSQLKELQMENVTDHLTNAEKIFDDLIAWIKNFDYPVKLTEFVTELEQYVEAQYGIVSKNYFVTPETRFRKIYEVPFPYFVLDLAGKNMLLSRLAFVYQVHPDNRSHRVSLATLYGLSYNGKTNWYSQPRRMGDVDISQIGMVETSFD